MTTSPFPGLSDAHYQHLRDCAVSDSTISARGYVTVGGLTAWQALGAQPLSRGAKADGMAFPLYRLGKAPPHTWVLRPDHPRIPKGGRAIKYEVPPTVPNVFDVLPQYQVAVGDPSIPIWITEGAKKADALATAYGTAIVPINENGVWGWRSKNSSGGKVSTPDLDEVAWNGRKVVLAFDSDLARRRDIMQALRRLAAVLQVRGAVDIQVLLLPQVGLHKVGVDDYLAQGHTTVELESHLLPLAQVATQSRQTLGTHVVTGEEILLPPGYAADVRTGAISAVDERGKTTAIYPDLLVVDALGKDLVTSAETMTIRFGAGGRKTLVTAPRAELASGTLIIPQLAGAGAAVHSRNASAVAEYLALFAHANADGLPRESQSGRFGIVGEGLVLPTGGVGFLEPVTYTGKHRIKVGMSGDAYPSLIRTALTQWDVPVLWLLFGLSLASPAIRRLRPRRNPSTYIAGEPSTGKTTVAQAATGLWGDPTVSPFRLDAVRLTKPGLFQTLEHLCGLPLLVDEAHLADDVKQLESWVYQFANGETYVRGGKDGHALGGEETGGALLLCGEARPELRHAGAANRVLLVDGQAWPPLGTLDRGEGAQRAALLETTWAAGAGLLGKAVAEKVWADWPTFVADVRAMAGDTTLAPLGAWKESLACAVVTLNVAFGESGITTRELPAPAEWVAALLDTWAQMLVGGRQHADPATDAWEALGVMLAQAREHTDPPGAAGWVVLEERDQMLACRQNHEDVWRVLTGTPQFITRIGKSAAQLHGKTWMRQGWILPGKDGGATEVRALAGRSQGRTLLVPLAILDSWTITP